VRLIDLSGRRFHKLTVIRRGPKVSKRTLWECRCDCGQISIVNGGNLTNGHTMSCGCHRSSILLRGYNPDIHHDKHGHAAAKTREYRIWRCIKGRCHNPNNVSYYKYGLNGITVCDRWRESFQAFLDDMGPCPPKASIDRINSKLGYEPRNCRWATPTEQAWNTTRTRWVVTPTGDRLPLFVACNRYGVPYGTAMYRVKKQGRDPQEVFGELATASSSAVDAPRNP
jgi:hypothetical protein